MTSNILQDKGSRKEPYTVAVAAKIMIAKVRRHIEQFPDNYQYFSLPVQ